MDVGPKEEDDHMTELRDPEDLDLQSLTGRAAASSHFISKSTDKCLHFFKALKRKKRFEWTTECDDTFQALKQYLGKVSLLSKPSKGEPLMLFLAISEEAISTYQGGEWSSDFSTSYLTDMSSLCSNTLNDSTL
ncbi:nynrin [Abeliophyllum distichum]|uniref:Nynrin n=1 Tax=Abeliophyllum distichum TaxID=126358 RepID=A0ABD1UN27_9LAMI